MPTYGREKRDIKFSAPPEPRRSKLGRFHPESHMRGHWVGVAAAAALAGSFVFGQFGFIIPAVVFDAAALVAAWRWGIASKGRLVSWVVLIMGIVWIFVLLTARFFGLGVIGSS